MQTYIYEQWKQCSTCTCTMSLYIKCYPSYKILPYHFSIGLNDTNSFTSNCKIFAKTQLHWNRQFNSTWLFYYPMKLNLTKDSQSKDSMSGPDKLTKKSVWKSVPTDVWMLEQKVGTRSHPIRSNKTEIRKCLHKNHHLSKKE